MASRVEIKSLTSMFVWKMQKIRRSLSHVSSSEKCAFSKLTQPILMPLWIEKHQMEPGRGSLCAGHCYGVLLPLKLRLPRLALIPAADLLDINEDS